MPFAKQRAVLEPQDDIEYFTFPDLLNGHTLAYNPSLHTLGRLYTSKPHPRLHGEQKFTEQEVSILLPLLHSYPRYASYELLYASFTYGSVTEKHIEDARTYLHAALDEGAWDYEMRPMRNILSKVRFKVSHLGLEVGNVFETGYFLQDARHHATSIKFDMLVP